jgi:hypothetical protein
MDDEQELEFTEFLEDAPEILEPEVEEFGEETSLPVPSSLIPSRPTSGRPTAMPC